MLIRQDYSLVYLLVDPENLTPILVCPWSRPDGVCTGTTLVISVGHDTNRTRNSDETRQEKTGIPAKTNNSPGQVALKRNDE